MSIQAYTDADLAAIRAAKVALATGSLTVSFSHGGTSITYGQADMAAMERLEAQILVEIQTATTRPRFFLTSTEKGL